MATEPTPNDPVTVVSSDSHVGPALHILRPYCDKPLLDSFDEHAAARHEQEYRWAIDNPYLVNTFEGDEAALGEILPGLLRNTASTGGLHDVAQRHIDMDRDGVSADVVFHGTPDSDGVFWGIPFDSIDPYAPDASSEDRGLVAAGQRIYNRWLSDFCSADPARHAGLCHVPIWDIDAAIAEVKWAKENGLRGVNFPSPQVSLPPYEDASWDPFFATCAELAMPLVTHVGGGQFGPMYAGPASTAIVTFESVSVSGRNLWHLIFSGVFDRHPDLTLVFSEVPGTWFANAIRDMESLYNERFYFAGAPLRKSLERRPRDYVKSNVYFGFSFMSRSEAEDAIAMDLADRTMWGSDYPHPEGTWEYPGDDESMPSVSRLSLANTFAGMDRSVMLDMVGGNAIRCFGLDSSALASVAERIGPTVAELTTQPDLALVPSSYVGQGFRDGSGTWT